MKQPSLVRLLLAVALVLPLSAARAREQGASLNAGGMTSVVVDGRQVAASSQGESVVLSGAGFSAGESVGLWLTFADGAVSGVGDYVADDDGHFAVRIALEASLPVGLHSFSARGVSSGRGATVAFDLLPGRGAAPTAGTRLAVTPDSAHQLETVALQGSGFGSGEAVSLWLTLPNGVVIGLGRVTAAADGGVALSLTLPGFLPVGRYMVTAQGVPTGATAVSTLWLAYGNGLSVAGARLAADIGHAVQRTVLRISAAGFTPKESVSFWQTLPDGAVLALGDLRADGDGKLHAAIDLSEALPTGTHYLSFRSNVSQQGGFAKLVLEPGPGNPGHE